MLPQIPESPQRPASSYNDYNKYYEQYGEGQNTQWYQGRGYADDLNVQEDQPWNGHTRYADDYSARELHRCHSGSDPGPSGMTTALVQVNTTNLRTDKSSVGAAWNMVTWLETAHNNRQCLLGEEHPLNWDTVKDFVLL